MSNGYTTNAKRNCLMIKTLIAGMTAAIVLAAVVLGIIHLITPSASPSAEPQKRNEHIIYKSNGKVYVAFGEKTACLHGADITNGLNGEFADGSLYYFADIDNKTGVGKLMRTDVERLQPELVSEDVCYAEVSKRGDILLIRNIKDAAGDLYHIAGGGEKLVASRVLYTQISKKGERLLFIVDNDGGTGDLYSWDWRSKPYLIEHGVSQKFLGFSPNAKNIYYVTQNKDRYTLFIKIGAAQPVKLDERKSKTGADCFSGNIGREESPLRNNGQMFYFGEETLMGKELFIYTPGAKTEKFDAPSMVCVIFDDGSVVVRSEKSTLYYKAPGNEREELTKYIHLFPWYGYYLYDDYSKKPEKRFLMMESYWDWDEPSVQQISLFEQEIGKEKVFLCDADMTKFNINADFTWLTYVSDGSLYLMKKSENGWSKPRKICEAEYVWSLFGDTVFDMEGRYFYYRIEKKENTTSGVLYRYDLKRKRS